ncbi:MAG: hypothetical protein ACFB0Z_13175 [Candidatus Phaeomarinobacter sp.]
MSTAFFSTLKFLFSIGPVLFGLGFMAPVLAELMTTAGITEPFGLAPIVVGLVIGLGWGTYALVRGSWI